MQASLVLDALDLKLLAELQDNGAAANAALAEKVGLSASQISRRRQALEAAGIITGYRALLDPEKIGLGLLVFIHVSLATHSRDNARRFRDLARVTPAILEAYALTGDADYLLKVAVGGLKELAALVNDVLLPDPSVERVRSEVVLDILKPAAILPLPPVQRA
jgi:DNA-binding Lrp family transcriptional regulator